MKIFVIGAGQVGSTIVEALHGEHDVTVLDLDPARLAAIGHRFDVATLEANGASRRALADAGVRDADLVLACTSRDEANLVAGTFARLEAPRATTVIRTSNVEYIELWRQGQLDVDFVVSSEIETAHAIARVIGVSAAVQTDIFADGQVQIVEYDVTEGSSSEVVGRPLRRGCRALATPASRPSSAGTSMTLPRGDDVILPGDRIVVIGSPQAATAWGSCSRRGRSRSPTSSSSVPARSVPRSRAQLLEQGIGVRLIEENRDRARAVAEAFPKARVYNVSGLDPDFLEREQIGRAQAAVFAMREDAKNHYAATLARIHGVTFTIAIVHDAVSRQVYAHSGIDVQVDPRQVTAEEIVRFAHDPRTQQVAMLENDRFEVLDITTRPTSEYVGLRFREMPIRGALIGAIVRDGQAVFPRSDDTLQAGDRVIVFTESERVPDVERVL